uniref:Uncharacterized protein n=1 Tax=Micrurus lemniscatus lemniscatus TaxID=129467 RepID=A0A2D4I959_MICLE
MYILLQPLIFFMASSVMILRVERSRKATFILICATCSPRYGAINSITAFISDSQCLVGQIWLCKRNSKRLIWTLWTLSHLIFGLHPWILIYEFSFVLLLSNSLMRVLSCDDWEVKTQVLSSALIPSSFLLASGYNWDDDSNQ